MPISQINNNSLASGAVTSPKLGSGVPARSNLPAGSVLQVVNAVKTDNFTTTSTSFVDVTGLSVTITPTSASSRILIIASIFLGTASDNNSTVAQLVRNSTALGSNTSSSNGLNAFGSSGSDGSSGDQTRAHSPANISFLDSPATTSATTYKLQVRNISGATSYVNRWALNGDLVGSSSITVMEIAA